MRLGIAAVCLAAWPAFALETDQYYAWKRPLSDATAAINAKVNADIARALHDAQLRRIAPR